MRLPAELRSRILPAALAVGAVASLAAAPTPTAPVARYSFEGDVNDSAGSHHANGTDVTYVEGICGTAARLDGSGWIELPAQPLGDFSVSTWFKATETPGVWSRIWDFGGPEGAGGVFVLTQRGGGLHGLGETLGTAVRDASGTPITGASSGMTTEVDRWYHVAVTHDVDGAGTRLYVDGTLAGVAPWSEQSLEDFGTTWYVGRSNWAHDAPFRGLVDEFVIHDRVLDDAEVAELAALPTACGGVVDSSPVCAPEMTPGEAEAAGFNVIVGTAGPDSLVGTAGADAIYGRGGADTIHGRRGDDCIFAGSGNDFVAGGGGDDTIRGQRGSDKLDGNGGDDTLLGGSGSFSMIDGGQGADTCASTASRQRHTRCES